jgi:hypothetical protein
MQVSFTLPNYDFDPGDGYFIEPKVNVLNSVDKTTALEINVTWYRLVCSNGMLGRTDARLRKIHLKSRKSNNIKEFLEEQLDRALEDQLQYQQWYQRKIYTQQLSEAKPSQGQIEHWLDKTVAKRWDVHVAARAYHIAKTGHDAEFVNRSKKKKVKFNELDLAKYRNRVPGSFARVRNAYDISQVLSWIASQRTTIQDQLDWMRDIPDLIQALLVTEKPITLSI